MKNFVANLNLRPGELRLVILTFVVLFMILNAVFVWPHFGDMGKLKTEILNTRATLKSNQAEAARLPEYEKERQRLEGDGSSVVSSDQAIHFLRTVQTLAQKSKVTVSDWGRITRNSGTSTNQFFEEQNMTVRISTGESELIDMLYQLGSNPSSNIRVRDLDLKPDATQQRLMGGLTLTASYLKNTPHP